MRVATLILAALVLAACGAETATTAAVAAKARAEEARQAKATLDQVQRQLDEANAKAAERLKAVEQ